MDERPEIDGEPGGGRLVETPAGAQALDQPRIAADRHGIGVDGVAGRRFEQQEAADDHDQQDGNCPDQTAAKDGEGTGHGRPY